MDDERTRVDTDRTTTGESGESGAGDAGQVSLDGADLPDDHWPRSPIEPEPVDPEHAAFVVAGALLTVAVVAGVV